jgi:hypothetical protein
MSGYFTKIEVGDPHLLAQSVWENLPPSEKVLLTEREYSSQEWAPLDERRFRVEPETYRTAASVANIGALRASRITGHGATETTLRLPGSEGFGLSSIVSDLRGPAGAPVSPLIDRPDAIAHSCRHRYLVPPGDGVLRKACRQSANLSPVPSSGTSKRNPLASTNLVCISSIQ